MENDYGPLSILEKKSIARDIKKVVCQMNIQAV